MDSKITAYGDCGPEIKRHLFLGRKAMTNLDSSVLKSRDITLSTKVHIVKASLVDQMVKNPPTSAGNRFRKIPWKRKWQPTPVFLPGEFHGQKSLAGYSLRGHKESDRTEQLTLSLS